MIRNILILVLVITIIINFKNICTNINIEHFYSTTSNNCHEYDSNNPKNDGNGYQCTIGCTNNDEKYKHYEFKSMKDANNACKAEGFNRLCTKKEVIDAKVDLCCSGWTHSLMPNSANKYEVGYSLAGAKPLGKWRNGCGRNGDKWNSWPGTDNAQTNIPIAAHCCNLNPTSAKLDSIKKNRTKLSTQLANKEMKMHSLITDTNTTYSAVQNVDEYNQKKAASLKAKIESENNRCEHEIKQIEDALSIGINEYRRVQLGITCGDGESCNTDESLTSYPLMLGDERDIFDNNMNNISNLNSMLSKHKTKKEEELDRENSVYAAILLNRQREVDKLTEEDTAVIKRHCNLIDQNIKSIQSSTDNQNALNNNAVLWSAQSLDKIKSGGMTDSPNQASLEECKKNYTLPSECNGFVEKTKS